MPELASLPFRGADLRLSAEDRALLSFLAEHRLVLERQLEALMSAESGSLGERLEALAGATILTIGSVFGERCCQIRQSGLAAIGSDLSPPRFVMRDYRHDIGVAGLWLCAHRGDFGPLRELLGERRLRSHDRRLEFPDEPHGVRLGGYEPDGRERLHYPDLLLIDASGHRLALELELTSKGRGRRELILGGYAADERVAGVLYLVEADSRGRTIKRLLEATAGEMDLTERLRVRFIAPIPPAPAGRAPRLQPARGATARTDRSAEATAPSAGAVRTDPSAGAAR